MSKTILVRFVDGCTQLFDLDEDVDRVLIGDVVDGNFRIAGHEEK